MPTRDTIEATVSSIYDAGTDPAAWPEALEKLARLTGAPSANLTVTDGKHVLLEVLHNLAPTFLGKMEALLPDNLWYQRAYMAPLGKAVPGELMAAADEIKRTRVFDEILRPANRLHMCGVQFHPKSGIWGSVCLVGRECDGPFEESVCNTLDRLAPHLCRAGRLNALVGELDLYSRALESMADRLDFGLMLLDEKGRVLFANAHAEGLLRDGRLTESSDRRLRPPHGPGNQGFNSWLRRLLSTGRASAFRVSGAHGLQTRLVGAPLARRRRGEQALFGAASAVLLAFGANRRPSQSRLLSELFGLTPSEAQLAAALQDGLTVKDYCEANGISRNTVKSHLSSIFRKTSTSRQSELAGILSEIALVSTPTGEPS